MPLPFLPPEVLATILEHAHAVKPSRESYRTLEGDFKTMAAACLVSRTILPFARRLLYATIRLKTIKLPRPGGLGVDERASTPEEDEEPEDFEVTNDTMALVETVTLPHLSAIPRALVLELGLGTGDELAGAVAAVLKTCSGINRINLIDLNDPCTSRNKLAEAFAAHGQRIRQLDMIACVAVEHTTEYPPLYAKFPALAELALHVSVITVAEEEPLAVRYPHPLRHYHHGSSSLNAPLSDLLYHSFATLRFLELEPMSDPESRGFDLSSFHQLETLHYHVQSPSRKEAEVLFDTLDTTHRLKALRHVQLGTSEGINEEDQAAFMDYLTSAHILRRLPSSTLTLSLAGQFPLESTLAWIRDLPAQPSLRRLEPPSAYWLRLLQTEYEVVRAFGALDVARMELEGGRGSEEMVKTLKAETVRASMTDKLCVELEEEYKRRGICYTSRPHVSTFRRELPQCK